MNEILGENKNIPEIDLGERMGITNYIDFIEQNEVCHPVVRGTDIAKRPFIVIRFVGINNNKTKTHFMQTFFQRYTNSDLWMGCGHNGRNLFDTTGGMTTSHYSIIRKMIEGKTLPRQDFENINMKNDCEWFRLADKDEWLF